MEVQTITMEVQTSNTINHVKALLSVYLPPDQQRLMCAGQELLNGFSLSHYNIQHQSTLTLLRVAEEEEGEEEEAEEAEEADEE